MKHPQRRDFLRLAAGAAGLPELSRIARAQTYPARPVRIIVATAPGGMQDVVARLIGQWLSERLGRQFIVENRIGGGANIATEAVVKAPPDGYTLLLVGPVNAINATLYEKLNFMFVRDISPVAGIASAPLALLVHPSLPARSVPEFIAYAKTNPSKTSWGSSLNGSLLHMAGELFKLMAGVDLVVVPYRGTGPMMTDLLGGQVQVTIADLPSCIEHVRSGSLRALAVTTAVRSSALAGIPTISDFLPGFEVSAWQGIGAPRNTPPDVVETLNRAVNAGLASTVFKAHLADLGMTALPGSPDQFGQLISADAEKWAKVIRAANIKPE